MVPKATVLLIDDDTTLTKALDIYLSRVHYAVLTANSGADGLRDLYRSRPDIVVLDVMMPGLDGWETCQRIRELSTLPIIMLTAVGQETDRIRGLRLGADDYICKPFSLKELEARIEAVLRRSRRGEESPTSRGVYVSDDLYIDPNHWEVQLRGERLDLTSTELRLLFFLAENAGRTLSHRQLLEGVWGPEYIDNSDYTKLFIWRLRQKIEPDPSKPRYILTERGIGYRMAASQQ